MQKKGYKEIVVQREVVIALICDKCGKEHPGSEPPLGWHNFSAHHESWGNDSIESYEYYLVCSPKCYVSLLQKAYKEFQDYNDAEIDDMNIQFVKEYIKFLNEKVV